MNRILPLCLVISLFVVSCGSTSNNSSSSPPSGPVSSPPGSTGSSGFTIATSTLPEAIESAGYRASLSASGGSPPYTWAVASGNLPAGLVLDKALGVITGIPTSPGAGTFELQAQDASGDAAEMSLTLTVEAGNWATTYYIDSANGSDSNSGTSQSSAWQTIAKVNASEFAPGDRILFKRGDVWREQLSLSSSGQPGAPILIDAYGSGAAPIISGADVVPSSAWILCSDCSSNVWEAAVKVQPNIVFFNGARGAMQSGLSQVSASGDWYWSGGKLYVWCSGNPGTSFTSGGVEAGSRESGIALFGISYVTVQNIQFVSANGLPTNGVVYAQVSPTTGESSHDLAFKQLNVQNGAGDGIHLEDCNNCVVQDSSVSGMARAGIMFVNSQAQFPVTSGAALGNSVSGNAQNGIATYGCAVGAQCEGEMLSKGLFLSDLVISGNTTHDNGAGIYLHWTNNSSVASNSSYNNTNTSVGGEGYGIGGEASSSNTFAGNLLYSNRTRGIELSNDAGAGAALTGASNNLVQYNAIHDNGDHGVFTDAAPTQSNKILYNVIWNHPNGACFIADGTGHKFYGNTCWNNSTGVDLYTSDSTPTTAKISIENNIFAENQSRAVHLESGVSLSTLVIDYNDYDPDTSTMFLWPSGSGGLNAWQSLGFDAHSIAAGPQFTNPSPSTPGELAIQPGSPAAAAGHNLGPQFELGLNSLSSWPSGVSTANQGSVWSMGAFPQNP